MQTLKNTRQQWIEAYYSGNYNVLDCLEADNFFVQEGQRVTHKPLRYQHIKSLVKHHKWLPERLCEKDIQCNQISATEYLVTGVVYSDAVQISIEEKWIIEKDQWRVAYLIMNS